MVYTRTANGKEIALASSGKLYRDALVLYDPQTGQQWRQFDGAALREPKKNPALTKVPAMQTTWATWKKLHPDTLVLKKDPHIQETLYTAYHKNSQEGIAGGQNTDSRLPGKTLVVALRDGQNTLAVPIDALKRAFLHQTKVGSRAVVVTYDPNTKTAAAFDRRMDGRLLKFEVVRRESEIFLRDRETSTIWSALTGKAIEGTLAGKQLLPVQQHLSYWFVWSAYNPDARVEPSWAVAPTVTTGEP